jgi:hypothetical protein
MSILWEKKEILLMRKIHISKKTRYKIVESACSSMCHKRQRESFSYDVTEGDKQTKGCVKACPILVR